MSVNDKNNPARNGAADQNGDDLLPTAPRKEKRLLNPVDRISEILFGLIMALTFTCTISIATTGKAEVKEMLIGAIGCNLAWGLVDAIMFILAELAEKGHGRIILNYVRKTKNDKKARELIADALPPVISSVVDAENLDHIRKGLLNLPASSLRVKVTAQDLKMALGIFLLVFLSTIPIALPFKFIDDVQRALRVSNFIAIALMFVGGWLLARYGGYNKWLMGFFMVLLGIVLVALTIALGG
ncbi:VIT1/CCC1 transporter family protein [Danxiaibacter flavus]|uniref:VIT1/CCC1 transporter family protein n=1 Tax=Danxiaibacter flavus TaxID=3049108 RepID=A0ABV3ZJ83_9BACT|nr:VIT1/CCC1 transporter family protein [Chitinophagaceae bacterium DXS]